MGAVRTIMGFGLLIIGGGWYFRIYDMVFTRSIDQYVYDSSNIYWLGSDLMWNAIPFGLMLGGVVMLIVEGLSRHSTNKTGGNIQ